MAALYNIWEISLFLAVNLLTFTRPNASQSYNQALHKIWKFSISNFSGDALALLLLHKAFTARPFVYNFLSDFGEITWFWQVLLYSMWSKNLNVVNSKRCKIKVFDQIFLFIVYNNPVVSKVSWIAVCIFILIQILKISMRSTVFLFFFIQFIVPHLPWVQIRIAPFSKKHTKHQLKCIRGLCLYWETHFENCMILRLKVYK